LNCRAARRNSAANRFSLILQKNVATTPNDPEKASKAEKQRELEQQVLMREVDEAVRTDEMVGAWRKYGLPVIGGALLGLAAFGGYLWYEHSQQTAQEQQAEALVQAMDELNAGNLDVADRELAAIGDNADNGAAVRASANMFRAGIALQQERLDDAVALYDRVANDENAPKAMRDAALVRMVGANFDRMDKQVVIDRLGPLATPDSAWFGSAGEMVAHAYLEQNKPDQAGPLLVQIAQDDNVPDTLRARVRQLAGHYGFDAIEDVNELVEDVPAEGEGATAEADAPAATPAAE
jgi:hypothetical protein